MSDIALALIKQLVSNGQLSADDVGEMCAELSESERAAVMAAWVQGSVPDGMAVSPPPLTLLNGGKLKP